jgi:hypothetical protein
MDKQTRASVLAAALFENADSGDGRVRHGGVVRETTDGVSGTR